MANLIAIDADVKAAVRDLDSIQRKQIPFATAKALTATAKASQANLVKTMQRVFDRPTKYTLNSFYMSAAKTKKLYADVNLKDGYGTQPHYLEPQVAGGKRIEKRFEYALRVRGILKGGWRAVPGAGAEIDAYGNMSRGQIKQIISYFRAAQLNHGDKANTTEARRKALKKGTKSKRGFEYFIAQPALRQTRGGERGRHLIPGIYKKTHFGFGSAINPVVVFVRTVTYRPRLDVVGTVQRTVESDFRKQFDSALQYALNTAR